MRVLFASSEIYPFSKSGGLADVSHSLPKELSKSINLHQITPLYEFIDRDRFDITPYKKSFYITLGKDSYNIQLFKHKKTIFVYNELLCEHKKMYGYENDWLRFGIFCKAVLEVSKMLKIELLHLNDWHTALCALWINEQKSSIKTVFTIHNLAYQGIFDRAVLSSLGIDKRYFNLEELEFYDKVNFLKAGIAFGDIVTTVSPTYAKEIQTKEFGCGLDGFLKKHSKKLYGVLNGIDTKQYNPSKDGYLKNSYNKRSLSKKIENKKEFAKDVNMPLFIFIGRLVEQKGLSLISANIKEFGKLEAEFIFLGEGDKANENNLLSLCKGYKNIRFINTYSEELSHKLYGLADFLLMPSLFEPCGLNQMIASRYGTIPIVHSTGGLKDSVFENEDKCAKGIVFKEYKKEALFEAVLRAIELFKDKKRYKKSAIFDMECDFSFKKSAKKYLKIYKNVFLYS